MLHTMRVAGLVVNQWSYEYSYNVGFVGDDFIVRNDCFMLSGQYQPISRGP